MYSVSIVLFRETIYCNAQQTMLFDKDGICAGKWIYHGIDDNGPFSTTNKSIVIRKLLAKIAMYVSVFAVLTLP